ncbi:RNA polymerase sigma factor [Anditalea andensis]|uniref:Uncharacterized protein n=1 Tax=Anditalea andensis TaxID=1048983 RepID=A0A074L1A3_9BACT|nr:sigma-70 family RNA polymerase sigma factor [Anditalea andensis]KEO74265.1 hypothetical protein EL17_09025 [Anditalea andensis]
MNYKELNDAQLWHLIASNDRTAFSYVFRIYSKDLFRYGQKFSQDKELVEDVIQDSFLELWHNRDKINIISSIKFYLLTSFRRELVRRMVNLRKNENLESIPETMFETSHLENLVDVQEEKDAELHKAIGELTERQKEAIYLKYFMNLSYEEIAVMMQMQVPSLYNLVMKAMKSMKQGLTTKDYQYKYK